MNIYSETLKNTLKASSAFFHFRGSMFMKIKFMQTYNTIYVFIHCLLIEILFYTVMQINIKYLNCFWT